MRLRGESSVQGVEMVSDSEVETSSLMPQAECVPLSRRPLSSGALPPVITRRDAVGRRASAEVRVSNSDDDSLREDTPELKDWTEEGRKVLELGEAVLKEVWNDARDYIHTNIYPKVSPRRPRVKGEPRWRPLLRSAFVR